MQKKFWFKHYNNASQGATLASLWDSGDYEAYGFWWRFLEMLSRFEDPENRGEMTISIDTIARETGWKPSKCLRVLSRICLVSKIDMKQISDRYYSFRLGNWLELQETGKKRKCKNPGESESESESDSRDRIRVRVSDNEKAEFEKGEGVKKKFVHPTEAMDTFFSQNGWGEQVLIEAFELIKKTASPAILRKAPKVEQVFQSPENFKAWAEEVFKREQVFNTGYFAAALLNEIGEKK